ncbi:hypothetical protein C4544_05800 [candidate division WS5 bacterium]|uniref:Pyrrolo-quinoline quinone repeat domain-containing protein n=1 Tax=candidate division WS5 bacterium TaxID=2093353 RepID=A0A419DAY3_9BACT|nr:MAG: hypothetical protein C4544_05800 [candidate division WS5 bacterium]
MKRLEKVIYFFTNLLFLSLFFLNTASAESGASPWPRLHGDSKLTGQSPYDTSKVTGAVKWRFDAAAGIENSPVIGADGTIYIADHTCNLYAIDPSGKEKWHFDAGEPVTSKEWGGFSCFQGSPSVAPDGTIYIVPMTGYLFAVSPEGKEKWRYPVFNFKNNWTSPAIGSDGTIYVGSESYPPNETGKPQEKSAFIYALNPDGTLKWSYDTGGNWSTSTASIADDGTIYMSGNDCQKSNCANVLFAMDGQTGKVRWTFKPDGIMEGSASIGTDGTIYFGVKGTHNPRDGKFYALAPDGKERWKITNIVGNSVIPAIAKNGTIYFGDWDGLFYAFDSNGKEKWRVQTPRSFETLSSSPAIGADGTVYFGSLANYFYAYTPDGKEKWKYRIEHSGTNSSPAIGRDGTVYVGLTSGHLVAFGEGTVDSSPAGSGTVQQKPSVLKFALGAMAVIFLIVLIVLIAVLKKRGTLKKFWLIPVILTAEMALNFTLFFLPDKKVEDQPTENTLDRMFEYGEDFEKVCPEKLVLKDGKYIGIYKGKEKEVPNMRQQDWISEKCPDTSWPK